MEKNWKLGKLFFQNKKNVRKILKKKSYKNHSFLLKKKTWKFFDCEIIVKKKKWLNFNNNKRYIFTIGVVKFNKCS